MKGNRELVQECTSSNFDGYVKSIFHFLICDSTRCACYCRVVAMMSPDESWVAKWQRIGQHA